MAMTLGRFGGLDIVPQSGFRVPTTVGVGVRPKQDVRGANNFYDESMMRVVEDVRDLIRRRAELVPMGYPWSFMVANAAAILLIVIGSALQRTRADLPAVTVAALLAVTTMLLLLFVPGVKFHAALLWTMLWTATAVLLFATSTPVPGDVAPLLLVFMVSIVASLLAVVWGPVVFGSAAALLLPAAAAHRLVWVALYLTVVATGWLVGYLVRTQQQLLLKQHEMQADLSQLAAADERRRIAREVHDVIAHSLSVTLLHVTGARRALQLDRDVDDAVGALTDAERLGRQAMADIRRTVGLLESGSTNGASPAMAPEPGIADIPELVDDFVSAGLPVTLRCDDATDQVSAAVGLALYRITQESLANIAKHSPASKAQVEVLISPTTAVLSVVNTLPVRVPEAKPAGDGRGLPGMRQRVELLGGILHAGPCRHGWSVRAEIPLNDSCSQTRRCPL
jgi:signal transduction histidine kinase